MRRGCGKVAGLHGQGPATGKETVSTGPATGNLAGKPGTGKIPIRMTVDAGIDKDSGLR